MNKLYVGSLGTLGIILEATLRLYPLPAVSRTLIALFRTGEIAARALARVLHTTVVCTRIELLSSIAAHSIGRQVDCQFPERTVALAVSVGSVPEAADAQVTAIGQLCRQEGAAAEFLVEGSTQDGLWKAVSDFPFAIDDGRSLVTLKASVLPTQVIDTIRYSETLAESLGLESAAISEAGCGIVRLYWMGAPDLAAGDPISIAKRIEELRTWVVRHGGSLVILSAPPAIKTAVDVWGPIGTALPLMRTLKQQFDPLGLLNPGRFVGKI